MMLGNLATGIEIPESLSQLDIAGITSDSRKVRPGFIFAALEGVNADGMNFLPEAKASGAVAVLTSRDRTGSDRGIPFLRVTDPRRSLALMAAKLVGLQPENIVAVTGTSGKTSVAEFVRQIFTHAGLKAASLGTIGTISMKGTQYSNLTTLDPVDLHEQLAQLAKEGVTHASLEASSHGLDQRRIDGVRLKACAFTNLGRDHLDYHESIESYLNAKLRLFECLLAEDGAAVFDPTVPYADRIEKICGKRGIQTFTVGKHGNQLRLNSVTKDGFAQTLNLSLNNSKHEVSLPLVGDFQVSNALIAAGLALSVGIKEDSVLNGLRHLNCPAGRLELVGHSPTGALIFVDYAHKPDALETVLSTLRQFTERQLVCVVGAGGDRDKGKRELIGSAAARLADKVIITDDNPRTEDPRKIRNSILKGAPEALEVSDRTEAIRTAISMLEEGDVLCIAGKGHETGQIVADKVLPYSDHEAVKQILMEGEQE